MSLSLRHRSRLAAFTVGVLLTSAAATVVAAPSASAAAITANADALDGTCASLRVYNGSSSVGYVVRSGAGYGFTSAASAEHRSGAHAEPHAAGHAELRRSVGRAGHREPA